MVYGVCSIWLKATERETENQLNCRCGLNMKANMAQTTPALGQVNKNIVKPKTHSFLALLHTRLNAQFMRCNL